MKICLINNLYPPHIRGGAERVVETIAEGLARNGHDVFIVATKPIFKNVKCQMSNVKCFFIPALYYNLNKFPIILRLFWHIADMFDIGSFIKVRTILKKEKPDMVMTHNLKGIGYLIPLSIKLSGIKHIHTLHDIQLIHPSGLMIYGKEKKIGSLGAKAYQFFCRFFFGSPAVVVAPSKWLLKMHEEKGFFKNSKKMVMPNPVTPHPPLSGGQCSHRPPDKGDEKGFFRFLYVGQIEKHKGIFLLVEAFKIIPPTPVRLSAHDEALYQGGEQGRVRGELIIVGDGSKMEEIKRMAAGNENIKFLGRKNKEEVLEIMRRSDCLVAPSLCYENSPTVIYEAFSVGLPVMGSNLGGIPELLGEGRGILFEPTEDELAAKIKWIVNNKEELKEITEGAKNKIKKFEIENYIGRIINI